MEIINNYHTKKKKKKYIHFKNKVDLFKMIEWASKLLDLFAKFNGTPQTNWKTKLIRKDT